ncbi:MAG TPA: hypothetical protein PLW95_02830 [bacterium]|nr:hypothetical protein [bacterium]
MKNFIWIFLMFIFLSGCSIIKENCPTKKKEKKLFNPEGKAEIIKNTSDLTEEGKSAELEKKITYGMDDKQVEKILGNPYGKYISESEMMEVWFYNDFYVGFDKNRKVIIFEIFNPDNSAKY